MCESVPLMLIALLQDICFPHASEFKMSTSLFLYSDVCPPAMWQCEGGGPRGSWDKCLFGLHQSEQENKHVSRPYHWQQPVPYQWHFPYHYSFRSYNFYHCSSFNTLITQHHVTCFGWHSCYASLSDNGQDHWPASDYHSIKSPSQFCSIIPMEWGLCQSPLHHPGHIGINHNQSCCHCHCAWFPHWTDQSRTYLLMPSWWHQLQQLHGN